MAPSCRILAIQRRHHQPQNFQAGTFVMRHEHVGVCVGCCDAAVGAAGTNTCLLYSRPSCGVLITQYAHATHPSHSTSHRQTTNKIMCLPPTLCQETKVACTTNNSSSNKKIKQQATRSETDPLVPLAIPAHTTHHRAITRKPHKTGTALTLTDFPSQLGALKKSY